MRTSYRVFALAVVFALCAACWSGVSSPAQEKKAKEEKGAGAVVPVPKWEYKVIRPETNRREVAEDKMEAALNKLGEEGWECVGTVGEVTGSEAQGTWTKAVLILKRPKR